MNVADWLLERADMIERAAADFAAIEARALRREAEALRALLPPADAAPRPRPA